MQIVIDIPDEDYKRIKDMPDAFNSLTSRAYKSIKNGTPLPKGHGRLIDADAYREAWFNSRQFEPMLLLDFAPTILEATEEEEE